MRKQNRLWRALVPTAALIALAMGGVGTAAASPTGDANAASAAQVQVDLGAGRVAGWVSEESLRANPEAIPGVRVQFGQSGEVGAQSASGCNQNVCIHVTGDDLWVSNWTSTAYGNVGCTNARFHAQSSTVNGRTICPGGSGPGVYYDTTGPIGYYQDGEDLCNSWNRISGYPCIEVHD